MLNVFHVYMYTFPVADSQESLHQLRRVHWGQQDRVPEADCRCPGVGVPNNSLYILPYSNPITVWPIPHVNHVGLLYIFIQYR